MAQIVYILGAVTCLACTGLLARGYRISKIPLLFWSSIAFFAFSVTNSLVIVDLILVPSVDLLLYRNLSTLTGILLLLYGLIREQT